jgi:hypothetical protein
MKGVLGFGGAARVFKTCHILVERASDSKLVEMDRVMNMAAIKPVCLAHAWLGVMEEG